MTDKPKLQKAIAHSGLMSRRAAEVLIGKGRVTIDGRPARTGDRVDPEVERVAIDGVQLPIKPGLVTYLLYKPVGVISTADDPQGRAKVTDLVPAEPRVYPVGRLDAESEGLMLLTNDGDLANMVMHPRYGIHKTYMVMVQGVPGPWVERLVKGVDLDDGPAAAISARAIDRIEGKTLVEIVMGEGRKRQIRRMCEAVDRRVIRLVRTAVGPITDRDLTAGSWRQLTQQEVSRIYEAGSKVPA